MKDRRDNDKIKLVHDKRSPFGPYKMDKVERQSREIIGIMVIWSSSMYAHKENKEEG